MTVVPLFFPRRAEHFMGMPETLEWTAARVREDHEVRD